jgi:hypothetical protein
VFHQLTDALQALKEIRRRRRRRRRRRKKKEGVYCLATKY